jgi:arylsulfatase A-like enzyme
MKHVNSKSAKSRLALVFNTILSLCLFLNCNKSGPQNQVNAQPNFIIIFCDDLGYGDLGCYGHPTLRTPNLDKMAAQGQKWTNFYAAASVCTPSRAAIMTGRLPVRNGMMSAESRVLFPNSTGGLPDAEITIAERLKEKGYKTACIGKWHLGHLPQYLPTAHGFDSYFGIPYSNDMDKVYFEKPNKETLMNPKVGYWNVPLMKNLEVVERPADQTTITKRYTEKTVEFIKANSTGPFFIYLAHNLPHVPLFASQKFMNSSPRGLYGDVVEEIDYGVGQILKTVAETGIAENTMVVFTSDNGPWLRFDQHGGSAGLLRAGKGTTWEGGMREPAIFWWPGKIEPGLVTDLGSTMDLFTTFCALAGTQIPDDRIIDGVDLSPTLFENSDSPRQNMFYYRAEKLYAIRNGPYKAHFVTQGAYNTDDGAVEHDPPLLFHLGHDPSEKYNVAAQYPQILAEIKTEVAKHQKALVRGADQLETRVTQ